MKEPTNIFGELLRHKIKNRGLTQKQLAKLVNIPESTISRYCSGERLPSIINMDHICRFLGTTIDDFMREVIQNDFINAIDSDRADLDRG